MKYLGTILAISLCASVSFASQNSKDKPLQWTSCPPHLKTEGEQQCTIIQQPLDHKKPSGKQIDVLVMRSLGKSETKKGQLWFLNGGPGDSLDTFGYPMDKWAKTYPDYDYYAMEHRGTGISTYLRCESEPASPECRAELVAKWGVQLGLFNPTQAAHDLAAVMKRVDNKSDRFLYGVSYGTYLSQRFITIYNSMVQGVILDGAVPATADPNGFGLMDKYDSNFNKLALNIAAQCDKNETCSEKLKTYGSDTLSVIQNTFENIDDGNICTPLKPIVTRDVLRNTSATLAGDYWGRLLYPATLYRINRCNPGDIKALTELFLEEDEAETEDEILSFSQNLNTNIILAELIGGKSLAQVEVETPTYFAATDETLEHYQSLEISKWPKYPKDQYTHKWAKTDTPLLILNGDMDPATPLAYALETISHFKGEDQHLVALPGTPHGALFLSMIKDVEMENVDTCGARILFSFINDVTVKPDTSCIKNMILPDFSGMSTDAKTAAARFFGTEGVWN